MIGDKSNFRGICLENEVCDCGPFFEGEACEKYKGCPEKLNETVCEELIDSNRISKPSAVSIEITSKYESTKSYEKIESSEINYKTRKNNDTSNFDFYMKNSDVKSLVKSSEKYVKNISQSSGINFDLKGMDGQGFSKKIVKSNESKVEITLEDSFEDSFNFESISDIFSGFGNAAKSDFWENSNSPNFSGNWLDFKKNKLIK